MANDWAIIPLTQFKTDYANYEKKRKNELKAVLNNLDRYMAALQMVKHPKLVSAGYIHPEQKGVVSIDQKGGSQKGKLQQTRLYLYADVKVNQVYLLRIGSKKRQQADVTFCSQIVEEIRRSANNAEAEES